MNGKTFVQHSAHLRIKWSLGLLLGLMYFIFLNPHVDVRGFNAHDPVSYIAKALSLWQGRGHGEQFANVFLPVTAQPIVFPLMLAPIVGMAGMNFIVLKLFMILLAALSAVSFYYLFRYFLDSSEKAAMAALLMMASPVVFGLSHRVLADIPLYLFAALGLLALDRYLRKPVPLFSAHLWVAGVATGAAYLTKQTAIGMIAGGWFLLLHPFFRNMITFRKLALYTFVSLIPVFLWHLWTYQVPDDLWYWTSPAIRDFIWDKPLNPLDPDVGFLSFSEILVRLRQNIVWGMANNLAMIFIAPLYFTEGSLLGFLLSIPIVVWLFWEWGRSYIKHPSVLEGFVFFSLFLLLFKYTGMAARYVALVYPAVLIYAFRGVSGFPQKIQRYVFSLLLLAAVGTTFFTAWDQWKNPYGSKTLRDYVGLAEGAKKLFPERSSCIAPMLSHWQVLTGHQCFWYETEQDLRNGSFPSDYVVGLSASAPADIRQFKDIERDVLSGASKLSKAVSSRPNEFEKLFENATFALYKVKLVSS